MKIYWNDYNSSLHLGRLTLGMGGFTDWRVGIHRRDGLLYIRLGQLAIAFWTK